MPAFVAVAIVAILAAPGDVDWAAFPPGTRVRITTRAVEQVSLPTVTARAHEATLGSGQQGTGVEVQGASSRREGENLWRIVPHDGSRRLLFPTGKARVEGELIALETGLVVLRLPTEDEVLLPLDGVASVVRARALSRREKLAVGSGIVLAAGGLALASMTHLPWTGGAPDPPSEIVVEPSSKIVLAGCVCRFTAVGGDPTAELSWDFGDGDSGRSGTDTRARTAWHRYTAAGHYAVAARTHGRKGTKSTTTTVDVRSLVGEWGGTNPRTGAPLRVVVAQISYSLLSMTLHDAGETTEFRVYLECGWGSAYRDPVEGEGTSDQSGERWDGLLLWTPSPYDQLRLVVSSFRAGGGSMDIILTRR